MLLQTNVQAIALAADKDSNDLENYYNLTGVQIENKRMMASNGHSLYIADLQPSAVSEDEWPSSDDFSVGEFLPDDSSVNIKASKITKISKKLPKKKDEIEILKCIKVSKVGDKHLSLTTNDLHEQNSITIKNDEREFPNASAIVDHFNSIEKLSINSVLLSIEELERLVKIAKKTGLKKYDTVELSVPDTEGMPVKVSFENTDTLSRVDGYIMPCVK